MNTQPAILIIFGVSGDLSKRYLLPAIGEIAQAGMLPEHFEIVGITRQSGIEIDSLLGKTNNKKYLTEKMHLYSMDVEDSQAYEKLGKYLEELEGKFGAPGDRVFYLSTPPLVAKSIVGFLGKSNLSKVPNTKLLLEKPFGTNLGSAVDLARHVDQYFSGDQVYRVDHYMAKEIAQNIIVFRAGNSLFKKTWNKDFIESIEIIASEKVGVEGRGNFYEQTGALRDVVQSHLLQLAALTLMELTEDLNEVPKLRARALSQMQIVCDLNNKECITRGQYEGYREEVDNPRSMVETFISLKVSSSDPRWVGVPITLSTGKALDERLTAIRICYKKDQENESNELLLRIQPDAGIEFSMWAKKPGLEHQVSKHKLHFHFKEYYENLPEAYEQVLFNAIRGDHNLFTSSEEVIETWRILDVVQNYFEKHKDDLVIYPKGISASEVLKM